MRINVSEFHQYNVTDTCAVWNVLSSCLLYSTARIAGCLFSITKFVHYECLHKRRKPSEHGTVLQERLQQQQQRGAFQSYSLTINDLQDVGMLERRKKLSKGELSSIALARKFGQAFLTDDQKARKLADGLMPNMVQTTPHLLGWLFFNGRLTDGDKRTIIDEHVALSGQLSPYFESVYQESLRCQLLQRNVATET